MTEELMDFSGNTPKAENVPSSSPSSDETIGDPKKDDLISSFDPLTSSESVTQTPAKAQPAKVVLPDAVAAAFASGNVAPVAAATPATQADMMSAIKEDAKRMRADKDDAEDPFAGL